MLKRCKIKHHRLSKDTSDSDSDTEIKKTYDKGQTDTTSDMHRRTQNGLGLHTLDSFPTTDYFQDKDKSDHYQPIYKM